MPFKKMEDEVLACIFNKIDNWKTRKIFHKENLENRKREKEIEEIESKNIPKDRRLERIQISQRLKIKLENRSKKAN